jgi:hypothetical protein
VACALDHFICALSAATAKPQQTNVSNAIAIARAGVGAISLSLDGRTNLTNLSL